MRRMVYIICYGDIECQNIGAIAAHSVECIDAVSHMSADSRNTKGHGVIGDDETAILLARSMLEQR